MKTRILPAIIMVLWVFVSFAQNNVGIGTLTPSALLDVRGNGISYDVFNASNDKVPPFDSILSLDKNGHLGIGTTNTGTYRLLSIGNPAAFSPQIEVWQGHPYFGGSMLADINDVGGFNGCLNLYQAGIAKKVQIRAQGVSYFTGGSVAIGVTTPAALFDVAGLGQSGDVFWAGNDKDITPDSAMILSKAGYLGLGTKFPQERLHVNGALVVGGLSSAPTAAGTISFNGTNFFGFNGTNSVLLDVLQDIDWITQPGMNGVSTNYNLCPGPVAVSSPGYIPPVPISDYGYLYVNNNLPPPPGTFSHLLLIDETSGNFNSSQGYLITNWQQTGVTAQFAQGIFNADRSFKISRSGTLLPTSHGDNVTMVRYNTNGITDLPNQSRIRANVPYIDWASWQLIQPNTWTPVNYTNPVPPAPLVAGTPVWDEQAEFTVAGQPNQMILNNQPNSYFTAASDGFYQVNARCEFEPDDYMDEGLMFPVFMRPNAYVSIAIYYDWQGAWLPYAIGNNLQVTNNVLMQSPPTEFPDATHKMTNNNAPNISDVVWLQAGDRISIWVFHWAYTPMMLRVGNEVLYVSIHKVS